MESSSWPAVGDARRVRSVVLLPTIVDTGLLSNGPAGAQPPRVKRVTVDALVDGLWCTDRQLLLTSGMGVGLVLVWGGVVCPEGVDRAIRVHNLKSTFHLIQYRDVYDLLYVELVAKMCGPWAATHVELHTHSVECANCGYVVFYGSELEIGAWIDRQPTPENSRKCPDGHGSEGYTYGRVGGKR